MLLTEKEQSNLKIIIQKVVDNDKSWLDEKDIRPIRKGDCSICNYGLKDKNEFNVLTRGLIVNHKSISNNNLSPIESLPFFRFYNQGEEQAHSIDLNNSDMIEKLDGCMVGVYFPNHDFKHPECHTRRMMSTHKQDLEFELTTLHGKNYKLLKLIHDYVKKIDFPQNISNHTLVFEFIHEATYVWTKYNESQYGLYLLGARNLEDYSEINEENLDLLASELKVRRPRKWNSQSDQEYIYSLMKQMVSENAGFEGFVFRDKNSGKRIKLKDPEYVKASHALDNKMSHKKLIEKIFQGEEEEIIAYFSDMKPKIEKIKNDINELIEITSNFIINSKTNYTNKKDMALCLMPKIQKFRKDNDIRNGWILSQSLILYNINDLNEIKTIISKEIKTSSPNKVIELLNIKE